MKIRKLLTRAAGFCVGTSLLATVLTSCSAGKIDEDLIIKLDDEGNLIGNTINPNFKVTYKDAIKLALTRADSWAKFKEALAEEIVYSWYVNRASDDKHKDRNDDFQIELKNIKHDVNDKYKQTVQTCKDKYGSNYQFYLQNQYLSPNGGTETSYKHVQEVQQVKQKFVEEVWKNNYFGYCEGWEEGKKNGVYARALEDDARGNITIEKLKNPTSWKDLGFFAYADPGYYAGQEQPDSKTDVKTDPIAAHPGGDYATIQNFVFDRWFETEKPFFSAAALFKYTNPTQTSGLDKIYNTSVTGVTLPENANEAFPFFGGAKPTDAKAGTRAYFQWYKDLIDGKYLTGYDGTAHKSNGTITIPHENHTDDSQTLLLAYGSKMIGGSENALYIPYASAAAELYLDMINPTGRSSNSRMNVISAQRIAKTLEGLKDLDCCDETRALIFRNFFFTEDDGHYDAQGKWHFYDEEGQPIADEELNAFIDLENIYGPTASTVDGNYHCRLFVTPYDRDFDFFYGRPSESKPGIKFITNTVKVNDLASSVSPEEKQPWIFELNEAGMHAQTIDGYYFVQNPGKFGISNTSTKELAKQVLKYRLMQKKCDIGAAKDISADVFGSSGALAKYFESNFANIILEIAMSEGDDNIFRPVESYSEDTYESYFDKIIVEQDFKNSIRTYINLTIQYDEKKKVVDAITAANKQVYSYHGDQVKNSKYEYSYLQVFNNGLTGPMCYSTVDRSAMSDVDPEWALHDYACINQVTYFIWNASGEATIPALSSYTSTALGDLITDISNSDFVKEASEATINISSPFSPQINSAKKVRSNRFWYYSPIVDQTIYSSMGANNGLINNIKGLALNEYITNAKTKITDYDYKIGTTPVTNAITSTYYRSKVLSGDVTYANVANNSTTVNYFNDISSYYTKMLNIQNGLEGQYSTFAVNQTIFDATLCYLMSDNSGQGIAFGNFYKILNAKLPENEPAVIGYIHKVNTQLSDEDYTEATEYFGTSNPTRYDWKADVDNIYDQIGYVSGNMPHGDITNADVACDQYWNVISEKVGPVATANRVMAGFTGLQTKKSNSFVDSLKDAVFANETDHTAGVAGHTYDSLDLSKSTATAPVRYASNTGAWFNFGGRKDEKGNLIDFNDIVYEDEDGEHRIKAEDFGLSDDETADTTVCRRLVKKIAHYSSIDDLRSLAKALGDSFSGSSIYREIGEGTRKYTNINQMRYEMAKGLPHIENGVLVDDNGYLNCFDRLTNVEVHTLDPVPSYCFESGTDGYNLMLTQISKADVTEHTLEPGWVGSGETGHWEQGNSPITPEEFFYMLCQTACESSAQSLAIAQAISDVFKDNNKLEVYDANLYNAFDSVWIKNWVKKPMGV